jgi:hypothetical protein
MNLLTDEFLVMGGVFVVIGDIGDLDEFESIDFLKLFSFIGD